MSGRVLPLMALLLNTFEQVRSCHHPQCDVECGWGLDERGGQHNVPQRLGAIVTWPLESSATRVGRALRIDLPRVDLALCFASMVGAASACNVHDSTVSMIGGWRLM